MTFLKLYVVSLALFFTIDLFWLGVISKDFYKEQIGFLMSNQVRLVPAILFYCLYIIGLVLFAISPAFHQGSWTTALLYGGFLGLVSYGAYDLTNLATLKGWPMKVVVVDMLWGTFVSGFTSFLTFWISSYWKDYFS